MHGIVYKILFLGIQPERLLNGFQWEQTKWRRGELMAEFQQKMVLIGIDDMDMFKGIELKLQAFQRILEFHPEWRENLCLVQVLVIKKFFDF